jgi:hypothetical protein
MDYIDVNEVQKILVVSRRQIQKDVQIGMLQQYFPESRHKPMYDREEVVALLGLKRRGMSFRLSAMWAKVAMIVSKRTERRLQLIEDILGIERQLPDLSEGSVLMMHAKAIDDSKSTHALKPEEVRAWYKFFLTVGPEYFEAVELYTGNDEPYIPYVELTKKMFKDMPVHALQKNEELQLIYGGLKAGRNAMFSSAFFYTYMRHGRREAMRVFPDIDDFHEQMLALSPP